MTTLEDLDNIFKYRTPMQGQSEKYRSIRSKAKELAILIIAECPDSKEREVALTNLQQTVL